LRQILGEAQDVKASDRIMCEKLKFMLSKYQK